MHVRNRFIIMLSLFILGTVGMGASAQTQPVDTSFYARYPFLRILDPECELPSVSDEEFLRSSAKVVFPVGKSSLSSDDAFLKEMEQTIIPRLNSDSLQLLKVLMRGAASPEGAYELNRRLGAQRAQALLSFLIEHLQIPVAEGVLEVGNDVEDYRSLCLLMRNAGDADYKTVQSLCDKYLPQDNVSALKQQLKLARGGRLWQHLLKDYFPQLRTARLMLCFRKYVPPVVEPQEPEDTVVVVEQPAEVLPEPEPEPEIVVLPRRELLSVKTNLLMYGAYVPGYNRWCPMPNIALEYYPKGGHLTFGASFDMPWWQDYDAHKYFQVRNYQVEGRYYLKKSAPYRTADSQSPQNTQKSQSPAFGGFYLSGYAHLGVFGICFDADRGWVGEGAGAGIGAGYVMPLSKNGHWRLEFQLQAGFFRCKYDPYQYENPVNPAYRDNLYYYKWTGKPELFTKRQYRWSWVGPTRIGITLSYDLLYRRIHKRGVSFRAKEVYETTGATVTTGATGTTGLKKERRVADE